MTAHRNSPRLLLSANTNSSRLALLLLVTSLNACSFMASQDSAPANTHIDINSIPDATPRIEPLSQQGNPDSYVVDGKRYFVRHSRHNYHARGIASWYGTKFHGRRTSNGEIYDMYKMTAAHKTLPLPSFVRVTNLNNGRQVIVRVNDRGPFHGNRLIDLSYVAARKLGITGNGTAQVEVDAIDPTKPTVSDNTRTQTQHAEASSGKQPSTVVANTATAVPGRQFYLQLGAFNQRHNAEQLLAKLLQKTSQAAHISQSTNPQGPLYRVRVGPFSNRAVIKEVVSQLDALGFNGAQIVADEH